MSNANHTNDNQSAGTSVLTDLDPHEISLVPRAANKKKFLILKADDPQENNMSYEEIEAMATNLVAKSAEPMSTAQAVALLMQQRPELYAPMAVEKEQTPREPSTAAKTCAVFKSAHEASDEPDFAAFVTRTFGARPELATAWYEGSMDNVDE